MIYISGTVAMVHPGTVAMVHRVFSELNTKLANSSANHSACYEMDVIAIQGTPKQINFLVDMLYIYDISPVYTKTFSYY